MRKCTLFQGAYPPALLALWDQFDEEKRSENYRPDYLPTDQARFEMLLAPGDIIPKSMDKLGQ